MKTYELPLVRNYCANWTVADAIRELLQNNIDYGNGTLTAEVGDTAITLTSPGAFLEPRTLLLGCTSKADDDSAIGSFGEGYKIALLVLARNGIEVNIFNNGLKWTAELRQSDTFGEEVLFIDEVETDFGHGQVEFCIFGLDPEDVKKVIENTLQLQDQKWDDGRGVYHRTSRGDILIDRPGKLYVNGLFVTDTELTYGYDIKPQYLKLERDRQTVSNWDLKWQTKEMFFELNKPEWLADLMRMNVPDVEYANHGAPQLVKEAVYRQFCELHPGAVIARSQSEVDALIKEKMVREVKVYSGGYVDLVQAHPDYQKDAPKRVHLTPEGELKAFLFGHRKNMNRKSIEAMNNLIKRSKAWK